MTDVRIRRADESDAAVVLFLIREAFGARPPLDPPAAALGETLDTVTAELREYGGLLAELDGKPVGSLLFDDSGEALALRRFCVLPDAQGTGIAQALVDAAITHPMAVADGAVRVAARQDLPATLRFWEHQGFVVAGRDGVHWEMLRLLPFRATLPTPDDTRALAEDLAPLLRAGDLLLLSGDLGAGKTTFTQGLGSALSVRGEVTSPTFVIARVHPPLGDGPPLVHVDAYRLGGVTELDDLDLDTSLDDAVTVVEWGSGVAEGLADDRLELTFHRSPDEGDETREVVIRPIGRRWLGRFPPMSGETDGCQPKFQLTSDSFP